MRLWTRKTSSIWLLSASCLLATFQYSSLRPKEVKATIGPSPSIVILEPSTSVLLTTTTTEIPLPPTTSIPPISTTSQTVSPPRTTAVTSVPAPTIPTPVGGEALRACIAHYESTDGLDPNIYQFTSGTWAEYGGAGEPGDATYAEQTRIFWLAWNDDGHHHWAAQKGRCF